MEYASVLTISLKKLCLDQKKKKKMTWYTENLISDDLVDISWDYMYYIASFGVMGLSFQTGC